MIKDLFLNLQLFGEGGEGGTPSEGSEGLVSGDQAQSSFDDESNIPSFLPEKAKNTYKKVMSKNKPVESAVVPTDNEVADEKPSHIPFSDLIKSDEYKDEHKAYMDKTISDRLKKYKGIEESNAKMKSVLETVATKYGLDSEAEDFMDQISKKISEDDSYYEQYALENDMSVVEARKSIELEKKVKQMEMAERQRQMESANREAFDNLVRNAQQTKAQFPDFDLETEMQNPRFVQLCQATHEDTTAAYMALHWNSVIPSKVQQATRMAHEQIANSVAANKSRPIENGLSSQASAIVTPNFKNMSKAELKAYAQAQLRTRN